VNLVLVDREALEALLREMVDLREAYAIEGGALRASQGEVLYLDPSDEVVTLAGLMIPGPLTPGTVPPAPPFFYKEGDARLRCTQDGKVIYTSMEAAEHAATLIGRRQPMRAYCGNCGHYHVSRDKQKHGAAVARQFHLADDRENRDP
jgi:hypothetical protein